jgi:AcrR family transcriptional regulator
MPRQSKRTRRERRRERELAIVTATRSLLDEHGRRDPSVERIAHSAGLSKPDVYRSFESKEEIFALTIVDYLAELEERSAEASEPEDPITALRETCLRYVDFCLEHPAFVHHSLSLLGHPTEELREQISDPIWLRLGAALAACVGRLERILAAGVEQEAFAVADPAFRANLLSAQILGSVQLARAGVGVREVAPGVAGTFELEPARLRDACVEGALAVVGIPKGAAR